MAPGERRGFGNCCHRLGPFGHMPAPLVPVSPAHVLDEAQLQIPNFCCTTEPKQGHGKAHRIANEATCPLRIDALTYDDPKQKQSGALNLEKGF